jgi:hypothetical protein
METALARFSPDFRGKRDKIVKPKCCFSLFVMENWQGSWEPWVSFCDKFDLECWRLSA